MEEIFDLSQSNGETSSEAPTEKDLSFYEKAISLLSSTGAENTKKVFAKELSSMSREQLSYCHSFYMDNYKRLIRPVELMFIDGYCELVKGLPGSVSVDELLLNDSYIARTYADIMSKRRALDPEYSTHPSLADIFSMAQKWLKEEGYPSFRYSEIDVFSSFSDESAILTAISKGCKPIICRDGVCVCQKMTAKQHRDHTRAAVIFASDGQSRESFSEFLSHPKFTVSTAEAEICRTREIFSKLIMRYDSFFIDTETLPSPRKGRYANLINGYSEIFLLEMASAFLTDEFFGDSAILVYGSKKTLKKLCRIAAKFGLSSFNGICANVNEKKKKKKNVSPMQIKINSGMCRILAELDGNLRVKLPNHDTAAHSIADIIPQSKTVYESKTDCVVSANADVSSSPLPFLSAVYAVLAPVISASAHGVNLKNGELSISVKASLNLSDEGNTASAISALLGIYKAEMDIALPITDSSIELKVDGTSSITVTAHAYSDSVATLSIPSNTVEELLANTADQSGLPDIEMLKKLISGEDH